MIKHRHIFFIFLSFLMLLLSGCKAIILNPKGVIALHEKQLMIHTLLLMLIVVIPVIILTLVFAWKYRASNKKAKYAPEWAHSRLLEVIVWTVPCIIIIVLGAITWISTHKLDPYRPLDVKTQPITIQAIALDWKWLFIYPKQNIATINFVQFPIHVPINLLITADAPMNSFAIPQLAGQIYAMPGMQTKLHIMATEIGDYHGFSANYSGAGFSDMKFIAKASSKKAFTQWIKTVRRSPTKLSLKAYRKLVKPSENNKVEYFSSVTENLYDKIIMKYMKPDMDLVEKAPIQAKL